AGARRSYAKGMWALCSTVAVATLSVMLACDAPRKEAPPATSSPVAPPVTVVDAGAPSPSLVKAGRLFDAVSGVTRDDQAILVIDGRIQSVGARADVEREAPAGTKIIDLGAATILPGLIDAHTHVFLQGDATAADYDDQ